VLFDEPDLAPGEPDSHDKMRCECHQKKKRKRMHGSGLEPVLARIRVNAPNGTGSTLVTTRSENLVWIDLEMTGLDPDRTASSKSPRL